MHASRSSSSGSSIHAMLRRTFAGLALPTTVLTHGLVVTENCRASLARSAPRSWHAAAAWAHRARTPRGAGCHGGGPRPAHPAPARRGALIPPAPAPARRRVPRRGAPARQRAHGKRGRVDRRSAGYGELLHAGAKAPVLERVLAVGHDRVDRSVGGDIRQGRQGIPGDSDAADEARVLHGAKGRDGLAGDLVQGAELDVVTLDQVDMVRAKPGEAVLDAARHPACTEVEDLVAVPADLGGEHVPVAIDAAQLLAEHGLGSGKAVVGRDVEKGDSRVQGGVHRLDASLLREPAVAAAQWRRAVSELGYEGAVRAQLPVSHACSGRSPPNGVPYDGVRVCKPMSRVSAIRVEAGSSTVSQGPPTSVRCSTTAGSPCP